MFKIFVFAALTSITSSHALAPSAPTLKYPFNKSQVGLGPNLRWLKTDSITGYHFQISSDSNFSSLIFQDSAIIDTAASTRGRLPAPGVYFWRVRSRNLSGFGGFSTIRSFTTNPPKPGPSRIVPIDYAQDIDLNTKLVWAMDSTVKKYWVQVSINPDFTNPIVNDTSVIDTTKQIGPLESGMTYYWRIRGVNDVGFRSNWTASAFSTTSESVHISHLPAKDSRFIQRLNGWEIGKDRNAFQINGAKILKKNYKRSISGMYVIQPD